MKTRLPVFIKTKMSKFIEIYQAVHHSIGTFLSKSTLELPPLRHSPFLHLVVEL